MAPTPAPDFGLDHPLDEDGPSTDEVLAESSRRIRASRKLLAEIDDRLAASERLMGNRTVPGPP